MQAQQRNESAASSLIRVPTTGWLWTLASDWPGAAPFTRSKGDASAAGLCCVGKQSHGRVRVTFPGVAAFVRHQNEPRQYASKTVIVHGTWEYDQHEQAWVWRRAPVVSQQERVRQRPEVDGIAQRGRGYRRPARHLPRPPMERAPQRSSGLPQPAHVATYGAKW